MLIVCSFAMVVMCYIVMQPVLALYRTSEWVCVVMVHGMVMV